MRNSYVFVKTMLILFTLNGSIGWAQDSDIFGNPSPIEFYLKAKQGSFRELFTKRGVPNKPNPPEIEDFKIGGELIYTSPAGVIVTVPVDIQMRGNTSQDIGQCPFPKLKLNFQKESTKGTLFEGQKEVALGTHCNLAPGTSPKYGRVWGGKSPHREALVYQMLEEMRIPSFKVRLAFGTYFENDGQVIANRAQAFFLEDMSSFLKRFKGQEIRGADVKIEMRKTGPKAPPYIFKSVTESPGLDDVDVARILFFQNLIRNNDFHLKYLSSDNEKSLWNIKAVQMTPQKWMVFPYDFDLSGIVRGSDSNRRTKNIDERSNLTSRMTVAEEFEFRRERLYQIAEYLKDKDPEGYQSFKQRLDQFYSELPGLVRSVR